jgi:nucleoside 2-deoxyribosyltransferase
MRIGKANEDMIRSCDAVLGVLDGAELDSGTVSEIGLGAGIGKTCHGLRTDFRDCELSLFKAFLCLIMYTMLNKSKRLLDRDSLVILAVANTIAQYGVSTPKGTRTPDLPGSIPMPRPTKTLSI